MKNFKIFSLEGEIYESVLSDNNYNEITSH